MLHASKARSHASAHIFLHQPSVYDPLRGIASQRFSLTFFFSFLLLGPEIMGIFLGGHGGELLN